jgi:hypothetical protein
MLPELTTELKGNFKNIFLILQQKQMHILARLALQQKQ